MTTVRSVLLVSADLPWALDLARAWTAQADHVTVVLLDGACAAARAGHRLVPTLTAAIDAGVEVMAHDEALTRRGIGTPMLADGVKPTDLDTVADLVTDSSKVVWL